MEYVKEKMSLSIELSRNTDMVLYGPPGCGKTKDIMSILGSDYLFLNN